MIFKNITKKNICILSNGQKIIIKPGEFVDGEKELFQCYRGLMRINNPKITPRKIQSPVIKEIDIEENFLPHENMGKNPLNIEIDFIITEVIETKK